MSGRTYVDAVLVRGLAAIATSGSASDLATGTIPSARLGTTGKRRCAIRFLSGYTPTATGADVEQHVLPLGTDNASITWNVKSIFFRVGTAGGAPQITVEKYTGTGAFSATTVGSVTLASGANEGSITSGFTTSTLTSADKVRVNVNTLGTAANWEVLLELQEA